MQTELNYSKIGERIRLKRKRKRMTQAQLAERTGFSLNYIGCIECGSKRGSFQAYSKIIAVLGVSYDEIFLDAIPQLKSKQEEELISLFRSMTAVDQKLVLSIVREVFRFHDTKAKYLYDTRP